MRGRRWLLGAALMFVLAACSSGTSKAEPASTASSSTPSTATRSAAPTAGARPSAGCTAAQVVAPGETRVDTTAGGKARWYFRHLPPRYDGHTPLPLVLDLHGYQEGAAFHTKMSGLGPYGDGHGFVTITPEGSGKAVPMWDTRLQSADMKFIGHLLDEADRTLCVDDRRVFVTGLSNGAFMTSAVACAYADRIAAAAPVAGIRDIDGCAPSRPVPVVAFHGTDDGYVAYNGGLGPKAMALPAPDGSGRKLADLGAGVVDGTKGPSIPAITAAWAKRNGCTAGAPSATTVTSDVTLLRWHCPAGADVELYRVSGGGHAWPGSAFSAAIGDYVGRTTLSISADDIMWKFFRAHPLAG